MKLKSFLFVSIIIFNIYADDIKKNTLIFSENAPVISLDPSHATDLPSFRASSQVYETLVKFKTGSTKIEPSLAKDWKISDDGLTYTFYLRKNVFFHKSKYFKLNVELSADDVVFSLNKQFSKLHVFNKIGGAHNFWNAMNMTNNIKSIKKIDRYTIEIVLNEKNSPFLANMAMDFTSILCKAYAFKLFKKNDMASLERFPIGTGPFIFQKWQDNDTLIFKANSNYWGGTPSIDKLVFKTLTSKEDRLERIKSKSIDMLYNITKNEYEVLYGNDDYTLKGIESLQIEYLVFNQEKVHAFRDIRVRQALNHAINKEELTKKIYGNLASPNNSPLPPSMWSYNKNIVHYEYNPKEAKRLLKEAGYPNLTLELMSSTRPNSLKVTKLIKKYLENIGLRVTTKEYDWKTYLKKVKNLEHEISHLAWTSDNGDPDNILNMLLSINSIKKPALNRAAWKNKEFNDLILQAKRTTSFNERTKLYEQAQEKFAIEVPWFVISSRYLYVAIKNNVMNFKVSPTEKLDFSNVSIIKDSNSN